MKNKLLDGGNIKLFKMYRNKISTLTRLSKKIYFHNYFQNNLENANILNRHFASIGNRLASDLPSSDKSIHNTPNDMRN